MTKHHEKLQAGRVQPFLKTLGQRRPGTFAVLLLFCALAAVFSSGPAEAAVHTVMNTGDSGAGSLRNTVAAAADGDTIDFSVTGTITLTSGQITVGSNLTITGPGAGSLSISGGSASRVFVISAGKTVSISGVTITNGKAPNGGTSQNGQDGGGIYNSGTLMLTDSVVQYCVGGNGGGDTVTSSAVGNGGRGGGIFNSGSLTLLRTTIRNNTGGTGGLIYYRRSPSGTGGHGGGIYNVGSLSISSSSITGNAGGTGGGGTTAYGDGGPGGSGGGILTAGGGAFSVASSDISTNRSGNGGQGEYSYDGGAGGAGGGIYYGNSSAGSITDSVISGNLAGNGFSGSNGGVGGSGGAGGGTMMAAGSLLAFDRVTMSGNKAGNGGDGGLGTGGIGGSGGALSSSGSLSMKNCTVSGNTAGNGANGFDGGNGGSGGGLYNSGSLTITSSTITNNTTGVGGKDFGVPVYGATGTGGGISTTTATVWLTNSIIAGNQRYDGPLDDISGTIDGSSSYNLIKVDTNLAGIGNGSNGNLVGTSDSPLDPVLTALAANSGPLAGAASNVALRTHALRPTSPALDSGIAAGLTVDQRGAQRPVDLTEVTNASGGDGSDRGSFEFENAAPTAVGNSGAGFTTDKYTDFTSASVLANDTDPNYGDELTVTGMDTSATTGLVTNNGNGTFLYSPNGQFAWLAPGDQTTDSFTYTIQDHFGLQSSATVTITVIGISAAPVIANLNGDSTSFTEDSGPQSIDNGADSVVTDIDNTDFNSGSVTVHITNGTAGEDVLSIINQGTGAGQIGVSGGIVSFGTTSIGSFAGGGNGADLAVTLNSNATPAAATALLHAIAYQNTNNADPSTATRTVTVTVSDGSGGVSAASAVSVTVIATNDTPAMPVLNGPASGSEVLSTSPTLTVSASTDPDNDPLTYDYAVYSDSGLSQLAASASGQGTSWTIGPALSDNTTYWWRARAVDATTTSGWMAAASFFVNTANDAPVISNLNGDSASFTEGSGEQILDSGTAAVVNDIDNTDFNNGAVTVHITNGTAGEDVLSIVNEGSGAGQIGVSGGAVAFGGTVIGAWSGGSNGTDLVISLNSGATPAAASALLGAIAYRNTNDADPSTATRTIAVTVNDGSGGASTAADVTVSITAVNDAPTIPALNSPSPASEVLSTSPTLTVNASADPDNDPLTYIYEVYSDSGLSQSAASASGQGTSWTAGPALSDNTTYWWRARATDGTASSGWMSTASFFVNTTNDAPTEPGISTPAIGTEVASTTPLLAVTNATDPDINDIVTYDFEVALDSGFLSVVSNLTGTAQGSGGITSAAAAVLADNTFHYWRARAVDNHGGASAWTTGSFFVNTANDAPGIPTLNSPADNSETASTTPVLVINNSADLDRDSLSYVFEVDTVNTFDSGSKQTSGLAAEGAGTTSWTPAALADNTTWYWRAKANDGQADSAGWMTTAALFVNTANEAPGVPTLLNPAVGSDVTVYKPTLSVNAAPDPDNDSLTYDFSVYSDSGLQDLAAGTTAAGTSWVVGIDLSDNTTYYWTARAVDEHGQAGGWMAGSAFFVNYNGVNDPPAIALARPAASEPVVTGNSFTIVWTDSDPDSDAAITLGYDSTGSGCSGTQIAANLSEDDSANAYAWDITALPLGTYYVYAGITDGTTTRCSYAAGPLIRSDMRGDLNEDGVIDAVDALRALRFAAGIDTPLAADLQQGDVAPLVNNVPAPDGRIEIGDVVVILRRAVGLVDW